ncbi:MAG: phage tail sheath subtilisin-like domain-containing protein [Acidobacteria bacterium]|nr:phage tail sheath subtilisin-like domain-containing protein [Acidobacteriota bacterium]
MGEAITEMIIPGTYIEVRAEGLIGVSGIATGNVGVVGTAAKGPLDQAVILSSFSEARETFGEPDGWVDGTKDELTLVRALQQVFDNGGSTVYAVRCAAAGAAAASLGLADDTGKVLTLAARSKGTWGHDIRVQVKSASADAFVEERKQTIPAELSVQPLHAHVADSPRNVLRVTAADTRVVKRLRLLTKGGDHTVAPGRAIVDPADGKLTFDAADQPKSGDIVAASYFVAQSFARDIVVAWQSVKEVFTAIDATDIQRDINARSTLVGAQIEAGAEARTPSVMAAPLPLSGGSNGETATSTVYQTALAKLDAEPVNIAVLAGQKFSDAGAALLAHVETGENNGKDRIAVVGADDATVAGAAANADSVGDDRLILVAPGIQAADLALNQTVSLPPAYAAASVAGLIASLAVQVSPTNKTLKVAGLTAYYNDGELKKLLNSRVMPLERKMGYRIVKGITTDNGPFRQVSVRRIVDYAKQGPRIGSLPYIGRLNNARVRGALKATLNGFLSDMVLNEALTSFTLDVTATREQEIAGVAVVTMFLKPTFSIDYIKVIMNLS